MQEKYYEWVRLARKFESLRKSRRFPEKRMGQRDASPALALYTDTRTAGRRILTLHYGENSRFIDHFLKEHTYKLS